MGPFARRFFAHYLGAAQSHIHQRHVGDKVSDTELLEAVRESGVDAFRTLFERYQPIIFRHLLFQTRDVEISHDLVQETFLRVWEHRRSLKPDRSFLAYTLRISTNLVRNIVRHQRTRDRLEKEVPQPALSESDDPTEALQLSMLEQDLTAAVTDRLPARCRTIFILSRSEGKSNREIAAALGLSVRTVEYQINRALKILRRELAGYL